jgi:hypothetical protein
MAEPAGNYQCARRRCAIAQAIAITPKMTSRKRMSTMPISICAAVAAAPARRPKPSRLKAGATYGRHATYWDISATFFAANGILTIGG